MSHPGLDPESIVTPDLIRNRFFEFLTVCANWATRYGYLLPETRYKHIPVFAPSKKVPASRLGTAGASNSDGFEGKEQSRINPQVSQFGKPAYRLHDCALNAVGTTAVAHPGVGAFPDTKL